MYLACQDWGISCLTPDPSNILMWSHYGGGHKGFCVKFRPSQPKSIFKFAAAVQYAHERPSIRHSEIFDYETTEPKTEINSDVIKRYFLVKADRWSYEQEVRVLHPGRANRHAEFDESELIAINVGCSASPADIEEIQKIVALSKRRIDIYQMERDAKVYGLTIRRLG